MNTLERLKHSSIVVADTGQVRDIPRYAPRDATTNPSLILKAVQQPEYRAGLEAAQGGGALDERIDRVLVHFGCDILAVIPGRVSTEVDARLSFDTDATVARARRIVALYADEGIPRDRVLIKIAATWEGIEAARRLEADGIHCNLTLLFAFCQAVACGDAGVQLISPFVGRILDWYKARPGQDAAALAGDADPGVQSVRRIWNHFKRNGIATEVMGASFRSTEQVLALAGCDLLTISPALLAELEASDQPAPRRLDVSEALRMDLPAVHFDERSFRWALNEDAMATEKLAEGIRTFAADAAKLDALLQALA